MAMALDGNGNANQSVHPMPRRPHPIASAFFDAHDDELETSKSTKYGDATPESNRNSSVAKIRNSLGWRTRYSSSSLYPISIQPVEGRGDISLEEGGRIELASFHVRQVFPRESNRTKTRISVNEDDCDLGTGATVWPGSIVLLKYLEKMAHDPMQDNVLEGKTVADLGSGTAITSVASALLGANVVVCTDGCDPVVDLARKNIHDAISSLDFPEDESGPNHDIDEAGPGNDKTEQACYNFRGCKMFAQKYRWGEGLCFDGVPLNGCGDRISQHNNQQTDEENMDITPNHFDIILGADCIVPKLYPIQPLVDALDELSSKDTVSYLSYEQRHFEKYDPAVEFRRLADLCNLDVEVVPEHQLDHMYPANDIQIWKVTRNHRRGCPAHINKGKRGIQHGSIRGGSSRSNHQSLLVGKLF